MEGFYLYFGLLLVLTALDIYLLQLCLFKLFRVKVYFLLPPVASLIFAGLLFQADWFAFLSISQAVIMLVALVIAYAGINAYQPTPKNEK